LPAAPVFLQELFDGSVVRQGDKDLSGLAKIERQKVVDRSKHFLYNARRYNNAIAGARFNATMKIPAMYFSSLCVTGVCQQQILAMYPGSDPFDVNVTRKYNQLYIFDTREATNVRFDRNVEKTRSGGLIHCLDRELLEALDKWMRTHHEHIRRMVSNYECYKDQMRQAELGGSAVINVSVKAVTDRIPVSAVDMTFIK
jgi:hypothetical protein